MKARHPANGKEVTFGMRCALCNEYIEPIELELGDAKIVDGEYWHTDCYAEYYDEELAEA
jgi:hypothetical protein